MVSAGNLMRSLLGANHEDVISLFASLIRQVSTLILRGPPSAAAQHKRFPPVAGNLTTSAQASKTSRSSTMFRWKNSVPENQKSARGGKAPKASLEVGLQVVHILEPDVEAQRWALGLPTRGRAVAARVEGDHQA